MDKIINKIFKGTENKNAHLFLKCKFNDNSTAKGNIFQDCEFSGNSIIKGDIFQDCEFSGNSKPANENAMFLNCKFNGNYKPSTSTNKFHQKIGKGVSIINSNLSGATLIGNQVNSSTTITTNLIRTPNVNGYQSGVSIINSILSGATLIGNQVNSSATITTNLIRTPNVNGYQSLDVSNVNSLGTKQKVSKAKTSGTDILPQKHVIRDSDVVSQINDNKPPSYEAAMDTQSKSHQKTSNANADTQSLNNHTYEKKKLQNKIEKLKVKKLGKGWNIFWIILSCGCYNKNAKIDRKIKKRQEELKEVDKNINSIKQRLQENEAWPSTSTDSWSKFSNNSVKECNKTKAQVNIQNAIPSAPTY